MTDFTFADAAAITLTPQALGLRVARRLAVAPAAITLTPQSFGLRAARRLAVAPATLTLTAQAIVLRRASAAEIPVRTAILDAIITALTSAAITIRGAAVTIERSRTDMIEEAERPLLAVLGGDMIPLPTEGDALYQRYSFRVILAGYLAAASEADAETDAADLHAKVVRALVRPDPAALPVSLMLADGVTEVWIEDGALVIEPASVAQSETPAASMICEMAAAVRQPWGNLFISA